MQLQDTVCVLPRALCVDSSACSSPAYTFVVMALLIAILGVISIANTPADVFPFINIPVAGVIWSYPGMSPDDTAKRALLVSERAMTTTVNVIEHIEATSYDGIGLIRVWRRAAWLHRR